MYKYLLKDIEESLKIILTDHDWHKQYYREIDNVFFLQFPWKRDWTQQPLEGAAFYIGRGQIVCSNQVPEIDDNFYNLRHPYYWTKYRNLENATCQEAKLVNHKYFHC